MQTTNTLPDSSFVGRIYGVTDGSPTKNPFCVIITRVTKKCVFARCLEIQGLRISNGNGYFNHQNLGKACIKKPLNMVGEEKMYKPHLYREADYIIAGNDVLFRISEDIVWSTLAHESTVWAKV